MNETIIRAIFQRIDRMMIQYMFRAYNLLRVIQDTFPKILPRFNMSTSIGFVEFLNLRWNGAILAALAN